MKTITREYTVYTFNELSDESREYALNEYRKNYEHPWSDENVKTLETFQEIFPIIVTNWEYGYRSFIKYTSEIEDNINTLKGIRLMKYILNNYYDYLFQAKFQGTIKNQVKHRRIKSTELPNKNYFNAYYSAIFKDSCCTLTGYYMDNIILNPIYNFLKQPNQNDTFEYILFKCLNCWITSYQEEYENMTSDEYITEYFENNNTQFLKSGRVFT